MHTAGRAYDTDHAEARQHQNGSKQGSRFILDSKRSHCHAKQIRALLTAARASGGMDECQIRLTGIEREHKIGTEISRLGGYGFRGIRQSHSG